MDPMTVLVVTADEAYGVELTDHLGAAGFEPRTAGSVEAAIDRFTSEPIDCVVSDYRLPDSDGVRFLQTVRAQDPTVPFILFTEDGNEAVASDAFSADATEYLIKERFGNQWDRLSGLIEEAVRLQRQRADLVDPKERVGTVLNAIPDAVAVVQDGRVVFCNETAAGLLNAESVAAVSGDPLDGWFDVDDPARFDSLVTSVASGDRSFAQAEFSLLRTGGPIPVEASIAPVTWATESGVLLIVRNISDRRAIETELSLKTRAIDTAPVGITIGEPTTADGDNPIRYANEAFEELTGYDREEVLGRDCRLLQGEGTDEETVARLRSAINEDEPVTVEIRNYRKDGTPFWNRLTVAPIANGDGAPHYVGFQADVTDEKERRRDLRRFERAVEAAGQAIFITDRGGTITYANPAFEEVTGYSESEAIGRTPRILKSGYYDDAYYDRLWETILGGEVWRDEIVNRRKSGETYHTYQTIAPLTDEDGGIEEFVAIQTDVTERKEQERHLSTLDRVLRHDLRNRLNVVQAHAESVRANTAETDTDERATAIVEEIEALLETADRGRKITDLLLEPPHRRHVELVPLLRTELDRLREQHPGARIELELACAESVTVTATDAIGEAVAELVENGVVHNDRATPHVVVRVVDTADGTVRLEVADDGPRIPEMERTILRETESVDDLHHGSGLDLWFVYWVTRRSNASLTFEENEPHGNVVTIEFDA